jgi:hypothetical protein
MPFARIAVEQTGRRVATECSGQERDKPSDFSLIWQNRSSDFSLTWQRPTAFKYR